MSVNSTMKFRAHDTFFIRKGWLSKGLRNVKKDPDVFKGNYDNPMDVLGIGANMVKALRYWMQAVGLTSESNKNRSQILTPLGELIDTYDPYIEEIGSLWLLHYKLAINRENATSWYYFFNEFKAQEFDKEFFVNQLGNYARLNGEDVSRRSLEDDFNCIINTYLPRIKSNPERVSPESNIDCPLGELGLIDIVNKKNKTYRKATPKLDSIPPLIVLGIILDQAEGKKEIRISDLQNISCNVCKVMNLDVISLTNLLHKLELMGRIKVIRTAGLDVIEILDNISFEDCVKQYYLSIE